MPTAFVLIGVETEHDVISELRAIDNVKDVDFVFGVYDIEYSCLLIAQYYMNTFACSLSLGYDHNSAVNAETL
jgi:hypothetical protein